MAQGEDPRSDAELIAASLDRPAEFEGLFVRHGPTIHRYLARRVGSDGADDLVADVFLAAFRGRSRHNPESASARPWLFGIAANLLAQHRRDEARHWRLLASVVPAVDAPDHAADTDARVSAQAGRSHLIAGLLDLARGDRDVLLLLAWEQLSYDEMAIVLGVPIGTIRSRLSRARRKLRAHLGHDPRSSIEPDVDLEDLMNEGASG